MAFEELPQEFAEFFNNGGELPASLAAEHAADQAAAAAPSPAPTPTPTLATAPVVDDAPPVPVANPYADRLIAERDHQVRQMQDQIKALQDGIKKANEPAAPDPNVDPLGSLQHQLKSLQTNLDKLMNVQTEQHTQTLQERQAQQFFGTLNSQIAEFKASHTDYDAAYKHLIKSRTQDYLDMGLNSNDAAKEMAAEEMRIAGQAMSKGLNPADVAYKIAVRLGYKTVAASPSSDNKLDTIKKGIEASHAVKSDAPPTSTGKTLDDMAGMSDSELNKVVENDWEGIFGKRKGIFG